MALTLATVNFSSIALLFRCFSKERLIWAFFNHRWFFWIPFWLNCSLQKHSAFLFQCFSVFLSCTFKNIGDILKFAERFIMMTSFHPNYLFFPTFIDTVCGASELYKQYNSFNVQWTKSFWSQIQKHIDVGSWSKMFRCPELEVDPENWVLALQPWHKYLQCNTMNQQMPSHYQTWSDTGTHMQTYIV